MVKESAVLGMAIWNSPQAEFTASLAAMAAGLESGVLRPVVGREYDLADAAQAQVDILKQSARGKMVLKIV